MYTEIGRLISDRSKSDGWGKATIARFSEQVQRRFPGINGFSPVNIWRMRTFFEAYQGNQDLSALTKDVSWTSNIMILSAAKTDEAKEFYLVLAAKYHYSSRELQRQLDAMLFERTMLSDQHTAALVEKHPELACLVAIELKIGEFKPEYVSQLDFYLEALDRDVRKPNEQLSVGLILCAGADDEVVEYALSRTLSPAMVAEYQLHLPDKALLAAKLRELRDTAVIDTSQE